MKNHFFLIDIGHPANVHIFRNLFRRMEDAGWKGIFTVIDKEVTIGLLKAYDLPFILLGRNRKHILAKIVNNVQLFYRFFRIVMQYHPYIVISRASVHAALITKLCGIYHIALSDTEIARITNTIAHPLLDNILTPDPFFQDLGKNQIRYPGYHELAYLHPNVYKPDSSVLRNIGIRDNERFAILRFVAFGASHDIGQKGISDEHKIYMVNQLSKIMKVLISSEAILPAELEQYKIDIKPEQIHDVLYHAHLFVGESGTMAVECAVLGTPNIIINTLAPSVGIINELVNRYHLQCFFTDFQDAWPVILSIAQDQNYKQKMRYNASRLLQDKIDVTAFLLWFCTNYPSSANVVKAPGFEFKNFQ
jgi:predicted glycosyltransferase